MDIVCRKQVCKYNNCERCKLKSIDVSTKTNCEMLDIDNEKKVQNMSEDMFVKPIKVAPYVHSMNVAIACTADCIHNREGECYSNGIIINSVGKDAECISYVKR